MGSFINSGTVYGDTTSILVDGGGTIAGGITNNSGGVIGGAP
jgi:hypothetical protein